MAAHLLPYVGWLLIVLGVVMIFLAGWRRWIFGVLLAVLGGMALWLGDGEARTVPRRLLLVAPAGVGTEQPYRDLIERLSREDRKMELALLLLEPGPEAANQAAQWKRAGELTSVVDAGRVKLPPEDWERALAEAVRDSIGQRENVTVAFDLEGLEDSRFGTLRLDEAAANLVQEFAGHNTSADGPRNIDFVSIEEIGSHFRPLKVDLSCLRFAVHELNKYQASATIRVEGQFPSEYVWPGAKGEVVLHTLVGSSEANVPVLESTKLGSIDWPSEEKAHTIQFKDFTDANLTPGPGWHYLEVNFTTKDGAKGYALRGGAYFEVASRTLTVVQPDPSPPAGPAPANPPHARGAGLLADDGWFAEEGPDPPPTVEQLRASYGESDRDWREDLLSTKSYLTWVEFLDGLKNDPGPRAPGVTVLIEPSQNQLDALGVLPTFNDRLRHGEQVVVCGFSSPITNAPPWLPAVPLTKTWAPATTPQLLRYNWQCRLDVMLDGSGVLHGGVGYASFQSQEKFVNRLMDLLALKTPVGQVPHVEVSDADVLVPEWRTNAWAIALGGADGENLVFRTPWTLTNAMSLKVSRQPSTAGGQWAQNPQKMAALMIAPSLLVRRAPLLDSEVPLAAAPGGGPSTSHWKRLESAVMQPRTRVAFLTADLGQNVPLEVENEMVRLAGSMAPSPLPAPASSPAPDSAATSPIQSLLDRRIAVDLIPVELPADGVGAVVQATLHASAKLSAPAGADLFSVITPATADALAKKFADNLQEQWRKTEPTLHIRQHGRVFDPRVVQGRRAPLRHLVLTCPPSRNADGFEEDTYAEVIDQGQRIPMVVASPFGEGFVTVLGYSPFAGDMWTQDAGLSGRPYRFRRDVQPIQPQKDARGELTKALYDGWGIQRLLDPSVLGLGADPIGRSPQVHTVEWRPGEARLNVQAWLPQNLRVAQGGVFSAPQLVIEGRRLPFEVQDLDLDSGAVQFSATLPKSAAAVLGQIAWSDAPPVSLVIPRVEHQVGTLKQILAQFTMAAGEGQVDREDIARLAKRAEPRSYAGLLWLLAALLLIFSPLARPWTAFYLWLKNRRHSGRAEKYVPPSAGIAVHAEATSNDWGRSRGLAKAIVQSGLPGGERPLEPGDALSAARMVTLSFLALPHLPPQVPVMKLRHISMLRRVWVLIDIPTRLASPYPERYPSRAQFAEVLVGVIAAMVLPTGAEVVLRWARPAGNDGQLVLKTAGDLAAVTAFYAAYQTTAQLHPPKLATPAEIVSGEDLFLLSDLRTLEFLETQRFIDAVTDADARCILCSLRSQADWKLTGLVRDETTGRLFDRIEFRPSELQRSDRVHENKLKSYATARGGLVIPFATSLSASDAFALLEESGSFRP